jgi:release factor glutamine methyltransferase
MNSCAIAAGSTLGALQIKPLLGPLENRMLLCHVLGLSRVQLITQSERVLSRDEAAQLSMLIERRWNGEPMAYLVGQREFYGLPFHVDASVLIPRPDTELLVDLALDRLPPQGLVLDMGTGSGAIAIALAHTRQDAQVTALDVSPAALEVARHNADVNRVALSLIESNWYDALGDLKFDLIVANPPYIASGDVHLSQGDLRFEPIIALTDHFDGLSALRRIVQGAARHLAPHGWLLMEHGYDQAEAVRALLNDGGYAEVQSWQDLAGIARVSGGRVG